MAIVQMIMQATYEDLPTEEDHRAAIASRATRLSDFQLTCVTEALETARNAAKCAAWRHGTAAVADVNYQEMGKREVWQNAQGEFNRQQQALEREQQAVEERHQQEIREVWAQITSTCRRQAAVEVDLEEHELLLELRLQHAEASQRAARWRRGCWTLSVMAGVAGFLGFAFMESRGGSWANSVLALTLGAATSGPLFAVGLAGGHTPPPLPPREKVKQRLIEERTSELVAAVEDTQECKRLAVERKLNDESVLARRARRERKRAARLARAVSATPQHPPDEQRKRTEEEDPPETEHEVGAKEDTPGEEEQVVVVAAHGAGQQPQLQHEKQEEEGDRDEDKEEEEVKEDKPGEVEVVVVVVVDAEGSQQHQHQHEEEGDRDEDKNLTEEQPQRTQPSSLVTAAPRSASRAPAWASRRGVDQLPPLRAPPSLPLAAPPPASQAAGSQSARSCPAVGTAAEQRTDGHAIAAASAATQANGKPANPEGGSAGALARDRVGRQGAKPGAKPGVKPAARTARPSQRPHCDAAARKPYRKKLKLKVRPMGSDPAVPVPRESGGREVRGRPAVDVPEPRFETGLS